MGTPCLPDSSFKNMNFITIDFETANYAADSACAVGLVKCLGGEIVETKEFLIRPPTLFFSPFCVRIHGLTARDVRDQPTFDELWRREIQEFLSDFPLAAHNAPFDRGVLHDTLSRYALTPPHVRWGCSLRMARNLLGSSSAYRQPNFRLNSVAAHFGITFRHHNALEDSMAVAKILIKFEEMVGQEAFRRFFR